MYMEFIYVPKVFPKVPSTWLIGATTKTFIGVQGMNDITEAFRGVAKVIWTILWGNICRRTIGGNLWAPTDYADSKPAVQALVAASLKNGFEGWSQRQLRVFELQTIYITGQWDTPRKSQNKQPRNNTYNQCAPWTNIGHMTMELNFVGIIRGKSLDGQLQLPFFPCKPWQLKPMRIVVGYSSPTRFYSLKSKGLSNLNITTLKKKTFECVSELGTPTPPSRKPTEQWSRPLWHSSILVGLQGSL